MGPPSYMRSVVHRNVVMRRMTVLSRNFHGGTEVNHDKQSWTTLEVPTDILTRQLHDPHPVPKLARSDPRPAFASSPLLLWQSESRYSAFHV